MIEFSICDDCKKQTEPIDGWLNACRAFKDGIPIDVFLTIKREKNALTV